MVLTCIEKLSVQCYIAGMPYHVQIVRCAPIGPDCDTALPVEWLPHTYPTLEAADEWGGSTVKGLGLPPGSAFYKVISEAGEAPDA